MADSTAPGGAATRWLETSRGLLSYAQLAPLLAERVLRVQQRIEAGVFEGAPLDEELLRQMHGEFSGDLVPDWSGRWRTIAVRVGAHEPPAPHEVAMRMRDYVLDLAVRLDASTQPEDLVRSDSGLTHVFPSGSPENRASRRKREAQRLERQWQDRNVFSQVACWTDWRNYAGHHIARPKGDGISLAVIP